MSLLDTALEIQQNPGLMTYFALTLLLILPNPASHPLPSQCELYYVNRDTLFSYHKDSEMFLQRMMALCVSSHYKNSPNDLQLLADAPAHHLFVLLGPVDESQNKLPDILCVVQFRDIEFPNLSGARIVRIAVHPNAMKMGYGSAAVELLTRYFEGQIAPISEADDKVDVEHSPIRVTEAAEKVSMLEEQVKSQVSGSDELGFFAPFYTDFRMRFSKLLSDKFKKMDYTLAMSVLNPKINFQGNSSDGFFKTLDGIFSPFDMESLKAYTNNLIDFNLVYDIFKTLAYVQASILLSLGLQELEFSSIELERGHIHSLLLKVTQELYKYLNGIASEEIEPSLPILKESCRPHSVSVDDDLREGAKQVENIRKRKEKIKGWIDSELQQYVIGDKKQKLCNIQRSLQVIAISVWLGLFLPLRKHGFMVDGKGGEPA
ncbi:unnamed protein product [Microthlaspi erraticum]|uniref:N-acetyltransferase domain-containing protein n=1 Tax=Microthlaspi erraticum TaxID=1685480 RepID=A0A6D2IVG6_9BRAS|nr:unnamed protein product [Microthlaspi erraticum]